MEPLAYVEIVGRSEEVLSRHPVHRWPVRVGRGYNADIIVDDVHVAPLHIEIDAAADGRFAVRDMGSVNGMILAGGEGRVATAHAGPDDVIIIGQTRLRVRNMHYAVRTETPLRLRSSARELVLFAALSALVVGVVVWNAHLVTLHQDDGPVLVFGALTSVVVIALWVSAWALLSRVFTGRGKFAAHGVIACATMLVLLATDAVFDYLGFGLDARWIEYPAMVVGGLAFGYAFYRHLRLASRAASRTLGIAATLVSVTLYAGSVVLEYVRNSTNHSRQSYSELVKAPVFLLAKGATLQTFFGEADTLKRKVDDDAKKDP